MRINNIYNQDCVKGMKDFPDKYFDAIVTDPPYSYPDANIDVDWIGEAQRISKKMFVMVGYWALQKYLKEINDYRDIIILYSDKGIVPVIVSGDFKREGHPNHILFGFGDEKIEHPCPIPLDAVRALIMYYIPKGAKVCDPFIGSGTTGIACNLEGVEWIGFENNETHYKEAVKRIDNYQYIRT